MHAYRQIFSSRLCPSTPTVYRDINAGVLSLRNSDLPMKLRRRIKGQGHHHVRINKHVLGQSIAERSANVDNRTEIGHWEGDLVKGQQAQDDPALITLTEQVTRLQIIFKIPNHHADTYRQELQTILADYGTQNFKAITFDNGSEFAKLSTIKGPEIYFAHPYSPWERGTNENHNELIREFIPKGHSLHDYDITMIQAVQAALNDRPRRLVV
nr:IS30 family transposase [Lactiplantibacillus plantarum]